MKINVLSLVVLCMLGVYSAIAQSFSGKILNANDKSPIPFVNIGIVGKGVGTVSDTEGNYRIVLHDSLKENYIKISAIGFKNMVYRVSDFITKQTFDILLEEDVVLLQQVVVRPKVFKTKVLGNENNARSISAGFYSNDLGSELGVVMHIKKSPSFLEKANFNVAFNDAGIVKFRVNIYHMKNGMVDSIILKKPIIVEIDKQTRVLTVDLKPYNIIVEDDFLVSLEWIEGHGSNKINFCAGLMNGNSMYRKTSQDTWKKVSPVGIGFNCTVLYEK
ncbi:MAG: carboxypeptidase-like regulatory domain-containing protein [Bacteroidia bacterium]|nr:carboxypeptidase-like regulatory domain-containing protein [Bacteroidia bacterium]